MKETTNTTNHENLWVSGIWTDNPALVKLLGLCPLLAVSVNFTNAFALGLATLITLLLSNTLVSLCKPILPNEVRIPIYVLVIATTVTCIELLIHAYAPGLFHSLGIFLPLIVTNCLIIGRAEAYASRRPVRLAALDAIAMGVGFLWVLTLLGGLREFIAQGTLFSQAEFLFGPGAEDWTMYFYDANDGILIALLPPGAFILLGLLVAFKNCINNFWEARQITSPLVSDSEIQHRN